MRDAAVKKAEEEEIRHEVGGVEEWQVMKSSPKKGRIDGCTQLVKAGTPGGDGDVVEVQKGR